MTGLEVKTMIHNAGLKCWQVAEAWGMCDSNFSRKLRKPFNVDEVKRLEEIITSLAEAKENASC